MDFAGQERVWAEAQGRLQNEMRNLLTAIKGGGSTIPAIVEAMQEAQTQLGRPGACARSAHGGPDRARG